MSNREDELRKLFSEIIKADFRHPSVRPVEFQTRANTFYSFDDNAGGKYIIKRFPNVHDFELELSVIESLKHSRRVCDTLFHSRLLDEYSDKHFNGPYFIVKKFYKKFLSDETNPLRLLERAAQEVDISRWLLRHGWRDLDGNLSNDAVEDDSRIVRNDLDGAHACWARGTKHDPTYRTQRDRDARVRLEKVQQELDSVEIELDSLAIRLSLLFMKKRAKGSDLMDEVISLKKRKYLRLASLLKTEPKLERAKRLWLLDWEEILADERDLTQALSRPEAKFLGLLLFHLLSQPAHGFSLDDLYFSLMLLDLAALKYRYDRSNKCLDKWGPESRVFERFSNIVNDNHEIYKFISDPATKEDHATAPQFVTPPPDEVFELQLSYDGDAWPSVSKGTGHICEDLVILPREGDAVPLILLADGATLAHGLTAIQIVRRVYDRWIEGFRKLVVSRYEDEIKSLIQQIHEELSREEQRCETTLVIMAVVTDPHEPRIMLTRFGNSGYLATFPREDGGGARFLAKSSSKQETKMLGAYEFEFQPWEDFEKIPLGEPGIYRLRAFSDGLTSKLSNAEEFLGLHKNFDIEDLTKEAADWAAQKILEVGTDDWSIAGFDIVVTKNPVAPPTDETITTIAAGSKAKDTVEYLSLIDPKKFQFSKEARTFWRNTLQQDALCHLAGYPMIQEVIGPAHIDDVPANQRRENQRRWQMATVVAAICILAVVWVWYGRSSDQESSTDTAGLTQPTRTNNTTPNPSSNQALTFSSPEANTIYQQLKTVGSSDLGRLPSGSTIEDKRLKDYLDGLAEVLGKTRWRVLIKVYTDKQGTDEDNRRTAELRATAIEGRLLKTERVAKAQIQMENVGESSSLVSDERTEEDRANNRRIVVTIRNTY